MPGTRAGRPDSRPSAVVETIRSLSESIGGEFTRKRWRPFFHVVINRNTDSADRQGNHPPFDHLGAVRGKEGSLCQEKDTAERASSTDAPVPQSASSEIEQQRCGNHGQGHGDPVSAGEGIATPEADNQRDAADGKQSVDLRNINLTVLFVRSVPDVNEGHIPHLHGLHGERESSGNERLRGNDSGRRSQYNERPKQPAWNHMKKGILARGWGRCKTSAPCPR